MKSKGFWILLVLVVLLLAVLIAGVCIHNWWHSPGVHVLGSRANIDLRQSAYVIDEYTGEVVGTTGVIIIGQCRSGNFEGYFLVEDYPIALAQTQNARMNGSLDGHYLDIVYSGAGEEGDTLPFSEHTYEAAIDTRHPENVIVHVMSWSTSKRYYVVHADSGEDALRWLNEYNRERYGEDYPAVG